METSQVGASTACLAHYELYESIATVHHLGFQCIEVLAFADARHSIGPLPGVWLDRMPAPECDRLREALRGFRSVTTHAPFIDLPLFTHNPGIRRESVRQLGAAIEGTARIGGSATVVHAHPKSGYSLEEAWQEMVDTYRDLGDMGARHGVRVCLETMYPPTVAQFVELLADIDHPFVGACVDTGHVAWTVPGVVQGTDDGVALFNDNLNMLLQSLGNKLFHFHVHDVRRDGWRDHRQCGTGCIDWHRLCGTLEQMGYAGSFSMEFEEPDREGSLRAASAFLAGVFACAKPAA